MIRSSSSADHSLRAPPVSDSVAAPRMAARRGPAGARTVQPSSESAISSRCVVAWTQSSIPWSVEAASAGRLTAVRSFRASWATAATCGRASGWPKAEPASRCSASSSGSAETSLPARSTRPSTGRGSDGALATALPQSVERRTIRGCCREPRPLRLHLGLAHAVEQVDRRGGIIDAEQIADPGKQSRCDIPRKSGGAEQRHHVPCFAGQQLVDRRADRNSGAGGNHFGNEADLALVARREHQLVREPAGLVEEMYERCRECIDPALLVPLAEHLLGCLGKLEVGPGKAPRRCNLAAQACCNGMDEHIGARCRQVIESDQALAEAVAAASAGENERHGRGGDCAIIVAH